MNAICRNCAYWNPAGQMDIAGDVANYTPGTFGACRSENMVYAGDKNSKVVVPETGLAYWDYEDYKAGLMTGAEFGCVNWRPREAEDE